MKSIKPYLAVAFASMLCILAVSVPVYAAPCELKAGSGAPSVLPTWYEYVPGDNSSGKCEVQDGLGGKLPVLILMGVFDIILFIGGFLAVIMVIYGGYKLLVSTGEPQKIAGARTTIFNALVGLAITIVASQVIGFIAGRLA